MASDDIKEGKFASMTSKQKFTAIALVAVVGIIIWQAVGLFSEGKPTTAPKTPATTTATPTTAMSPTAPQLPGAIDTTAPAPTPAVAPQMNQPGTTMPMTQGAEETRLHQAPVATDNPLLEAQKKTESQYIDQLNQLQTLRVQREIAETNQAIAAARLATVAAEKNVSDLLTRPSEPLTPPPPPIPAGAYANALVTPVPAGEVVTEAPPQPLPLQEPEYVVISVAKQLGHWSAVMGYQGKLYHVTVGDVLPFDNSIVLGINKNGVTIANKAGKRKRISILTAI